MAIGVYASIPHAAIPSPRAEEARLTTGAVGEPDVPLTPRVLALSHDFCQNGCQEVPNERPAAASATTGLKSKLERGGRDFHSAWLSGLLYQPKSTASRRDAQFSSGPPNSHLRKARHVGEHCRVTQKCNHHHLLARYISWEA